MCLCPPDKIGVLAARVMPFIRQFMVGRADTVESEFEFELRLFAIRKQIEKAILGDDLSAGGDFYICSLSSRTLVYKGLIWPTSFRISISIWPTRRW